MKINIDLTWSKLMALVVILLASGLDYFVMKGNMTFMFALPFCVFLITGKQVIDMKKGS